MKYFHPKLYPGADSAGGEQAGPEEGRGDGGEPRQAGADSGLACALMFIFICCSEVTCSLCCKVDGFPTATAHRWMGGMLYEVRRCGGWWQAMMWSPLMM